MNEGTVLGTDVGLRDGDALVGLAEYFDVGCRLGRFDGAVGFVEGIGVGLVDGNNDGAALVGDSKGITVGLGDGLNDGVLDTTRYDLQLLSAGCMMFVTKNMITQFGVPVPVDVLTLIPAQL